MSTIIEISIYLYDSKTTYRAHVAIYDGRDACADGSAPIFRFSSQQSHRSDTKHTYLYSLVDGREQKVISNHRKCTDVTTNGTRTARDKKIVTANVCDFMNHEKF